MLTTITEQRLVVVSDVHLGNALFHARRPFVEFLRHVRKAGYALCINGDGVDIVQTTLRQITRDLSDCTSELRKFKQEGLPVYYTVGNHDIVLEHFLDDWEIVRLAPFLNLSSGDKRIRIEHGHLYDESFVNHPRIYVLTTLMGGAALRIHPRAYKLLESGRPLLEGVGHLFGRLAGRKPPEPAPGETIPNEPMGFRERALEISRHGFDAVIFGHTHHEGAVTLGSGATYVNTGSWLFEPHFAEVDHGRVVLRRVADWLGEAKVEGK
ncbi:MAG: UDP-2,3-diacylglucosamine diphosphatase [Isosphaeraceae bacterium]